MGASDVAVILSGDASENQIVDENGKYSFNILHGRNYTITLSKTGYNFTPEQRSFSNVITNQTQDFSF